MASPAYSLQRVAPEAWYAVLDEFDDANIYQTPAFAAGTSHSASAETLVVVSGTGLVAAALVRVFAAPLLGPAVAYILHGPLWQIRHADPDPEVFRQAIRLLRNEYVDRRGVTLRIKPRPTLAGTDADTAPLAQLHYRIARAPETSRTILIDLGRAPQELRRGLAPRWRNRLNRAERRGLTLVEGTDDAMFDLYLPMHQEMVARKRLAEPGDPQAFMAVQHLLPDHHKTRVIVAMHGSRPCAGAIVSATGRRGIYLFGATGEAGLRNYASYLVHWRAIEWVHSRHCTEYDLNGINPASNPGLYGFKSGLCGRNGQEVDAPPTLDAYAGVRGGLALRAADLVKEHSTTLREIFTRYRPFR